MIGWIARVFPSLVSGVTALFNPVVLVLIAAIAAFAGWQCYLLGAAKLDRYKVAQFEQGTKFNAKRAAVTARVAAGHNKVKAKTQVVTKTVEKEVIRYVQSNPGLCLDPEWRRLHDNAANNAIPDTGSGVDAEGRTAPRAAEALETVTENYAACHRTADRLDALQLWVTEQERLRP